MSESMSVSVTDAIQRGILPLVGMLPPRLLDRNITAATRAELVQAVTAGLGVTSEQVEAAIASRRAMESHRLVPIWPSTLRRCYVLAALARRVAE